MKISDHYYNLTDHFSIIDSINDKACITDSDGNIICVNDDWVHFAEENGYKSSDFTLGSNYLNITRTAASGGSHEGARVLKGLEQLIAGEREKFSMAYECHSSDTERWFRLQVKKLSIENNDFLIISHHNITRERRILMLARDRNRRLKWANTQLRKEVEHGTKLARSRDRFFANISHEIRTPLNAILGVTQLLKYENFSDENRELIESLRASGRNLLHLVNNVLQLVRINEKEFNLNFDDFHVNDDLISSLTPYRIIGRSRELSFNIITDDIADMYLYSDLTRIQQILNNLISNALKFTAEGGVQVAMRVLKKVNKLATIELRVSDTGRGIPKDKIEKIFQPFSQTSLTDAAISNGAGLGLSICISLTEALGGQIRVNSPGRFLDKTRGTDFIVTLPVKLSEKQNNISQLNPLSGLKVLIVDDEHINTVILSKMLAGAACTVITAENSAQALKALDENPDIILMDRHLRDENGIELSQEIRSRGIFSPIIMVSAEERQHDLSYYRKLGINSYISKPVLKKQLIRELSTLVSSDRSSDGFSQSQAPEI